MVVIIDVHTHLGSVRSYAPVLKGMITVSKDDLKEYMDTVGVDYVVLLSTPESRPDIGEDIYDAWKVLDACRGEDRLIPFCSINPTTEGFLETVEKLYEEGARGFGEYKVRLRVDHPSSKAIYELCGRLGMPVLLHMDREHNMDVQAFIEVAKTYSNTVFIAHGPGWWREISANPPPDVDYPKGPVKPGGLVEKVLKELPNVYADISATSGLNALSRDLGYSRKFLRECQSKILYGTDFPCICDYGDQYGPNKRHLNLLKKLELEEEVYEAITYKNAERILKI
ncbi:hypothetical protein CW710_00050 [Candidatus Bathyarchaeota archaeon]|nr:amidohydrolase family protein [Candidatus Bathyarchaeota archaeon]RJS75081.1 MAG: hypothetical protein CW710_00050 [Candidatus Bathyarchaeota archaeon]